MLDERMLAILVQLFFICFLLVVIGEPFRFFILRRFKLFLNLDFVQTCILDIYIGGLILYVFAMLPFKLFNWIFVFCFSSISVIVSFAIHFGALKKALNILKAKTFFTKSSAEVFSSYIVVFAMFAIFLLLNLFSVSNIIFGSTLDESIHSLHVQVILENKYVPLTLQPYLPEGIIYPQASHVLFAFASFFLKIEIPKVVLYVTILFKALSVLAAYFLGSKIGSNRIHGLGLSFVFTFISMWPLFITWGGNPFAVGFPLFLVCLGLFFSLFGAREENSYAELLIIGLFFGYAGAIILSYLQTLMGIALLILIYYGFRRYRVSRLFLKFVVIFGISLLPLSPFLYRFFAFYQYPGHNIGLPYDFTRWELYQYYMNITPQFHIAQALQWAFDNLAPYFFLRVWIILTLTIFAILIWRTKTYKDMKLTIAFASATFVSTTLLSFFAFFLPAEFSVISWGHQGILMSIFLSMLIATLYVKVAMLCNEWAKKHLCISFFKRLYASSVLAIAFLSLVTIPFVYYRFLEDPTTLRNNYWTYAITTTDDYNLMLWMKENLSSSAVILVHPFEAGLFIPTISHHKIVFPYSGSTLSRRYQNVVRLMENKTMNVTTYELMHDLGVSHVFVGAQVASCEGYFMWVPELFLGNPNFKLVKNFGRAYLFELNYTDPNIVFLDDFEYDIWDQNLWWTFSFGQGLGNVSITEEHGYMGSQCLRIKAEMLPTVWNWQYAYGVGRRIFVSNASEVDFSFHFNATQGFSGKDTFAVLISNIYHNQSLVVATNNPHGVYENYASIIVLNEGFFEFKGNQSLSALWFERFNSTLPNTFILDFVVLDLDGIENIVYIDNVQVTLVPLPVQDEVG